MSRAGEIYGKAAVVLVFIAIAVSTYHPVQLGDFWWHLATGRYIVENGTLPDADPFNYTSGDLSPHKVVYLKGQWLSQSALYLSVKIFGFKGVLVARSLVFMSIFVILYVLMRRKGLVRPLSLLLLLAIVLGMKNYSPLRPLIVSFPLTLLLFALLDRLRSEAGAFRDPRLLAALPLTMALWSNVHGAYIVGVGMICIYTASEFLVTIKRGSLDRRFMVIASTLALAILASGLNPMGLEFMSPKHILGFLSKGAVEGTESIGSVIEWYSPASFFRYSGRGSYFYSLIAATAVLAASFAVNWRRVNIFHLLIALMFTSVAWLSFRYGVYLFMFAALFTAYNLTGLKLTGQEEERLYAVPIVAALAILYVVWPSSWTVFQSSILPTGAISYVKENRAPKRLFAPYVWGGLLDWHLHPDYKTFIDGRVLSEEAYRDYSTIMTGTEASSGLLDEYDIKTVLLYILSPGDRKIPALLFSLLNDDQWDAVYMDGLSLVFERKELSPSTVLSKDKIWNDLIGFGVARAKIYPDSALSHSQLGITYYYRGKMAEAGESFMRALAINPRDADSLNFMQEIQRGGNK